MATAALYYPVGGGAAPQTNYNVNPAPRGGQGAFGAVPGAVGLPSPARDLSALYPNLSGQNTQISKNVMSELMGELSPEAQRAIQDSAATFGVTSGMPGSGLAGFRGLRDIGRSVEELQGKGLQDYLNAVTGISKTQTVSPELQTEIATQNAVWGAAPDPAAAAAEQENLFEKYLQETKSPAGGTGQNPLGANIPSWVSQIRKPHYGLGGGLELGPTAWEYS